MALTPFFSQRYCCMKAILIKISVLYQAIKSDKKLFSISLFLCPFVSLMLYGIGYSKTKIFLQKVHSLLSSCKARTESNINNALSIAEIVNFASKFSIIPVRCLSRSLTLWFLLRCRNIDSIIIIGAQKTQSGKLSVHAWVNISGQPLLELDSVISKFTVFTADIQNRHEI